MICRYKITSTAIQALLQWTMYNILKKDLEFNQDPLY